MVKPFQVVMALLVGCGGSSQTGGGGSETTPEASNATEQTAAPRYELRTDDPPVVLSNERRVRVVVVPVRSVNGGEDAVLIQVKRADSEIDGAVLPYRYFSTKSGRRGYETFLHGEPRVPLNMPELLSRRTAWKLYPPGTVNKVILLEVEKGAQVDGAAIIETYDKQVASGLTASLAPWTRRGWQAHQDKWFAEVMKEETGAACDGLPGSIDWSSVEDGWFSESSIARTCARPVWSIGQFCRRYPHRIAELRNSGGLVCRFKGPRDTVTVPNAGLTKSEHGLLYTPNRDTRNQNSENSDVYHRLLSMFGEEREVLRDGSRHIIIDRRKGKRLFRQVFVGSDSQFWPQRVGAYGTRTSKEDDENYNMWAGGDRAVLVRDIENRWKILCGERERGRKLERVIGAKRKKILATAKFEKDAKWKRAPYFLARDAKGVYYYVDRYREEYGGKRYRVFIGRRGQQKLSKLVNVVEDKRGTLFATKNGDLRLAVDQRGGTSGHWMRKGKRVSLTTVDIGANRKLVYEELGAYLGVEFGHLCEN